MNKFVKVLWMKDFGVRKIDVIVRVLKSVLFDIKH